VVGIVVILVLAVVLMAVVMPRFVYGRNSKAPKGKGTGPDAEGHPPGQP
jgi:hypothetical protein